MRSHRKRGLLVVGLLIVGLATSVSAAQSAQQKGADASAKIGAKKIGVLSYIQAAEGPRRQASAASALSKALGWKTIVFDAQGNPRRFATGMNSLIAQKVDAILVLWVPGPALGDTVKKAKAAGIAVASVTAGPTPQQPIDFSPDPKKLGSLQAAAIRTLLPNGGGIYSHEFSVVPYAAAVYKAFEASIAGSQVKVVAKHTANPQDLLPDAQKSMAAALSANPDLAGVYTISDPYLPGLYQALSAAGKDQVPVVSANGDGIALDFIRQGKNLSTVAQPFEELVYHSYNYFIQRFGGLKPGVPKPVGALKIINKKNVPRSGTFFTGDKKVMAKYRVTWCKLYGLGC